MAWRYNIEYTVVVCISSAHNEFFFVYLKFLDFIDEDKTTS